MIILVTSRKFDAITSLAGLATVVPNGVTKRDLDEKECQTTSGQCNLMNNEILGL